MFQWVHAKEKLPPLPEKLDRSILKTDNLTGSRPEYEQAKWELESEKTRLEYADNQDWPTLNLVATYGKSALNDSMSSANSDLGGSEYSFWTVGVNFSIPFMSKQTESALEAANLRFISAEIGLKNIQARIQDEIYSAFSDLEQSYYDADKTRLVSKRLKQLLEDARKKSAQGRLGKKDLLSREIDWLQAQLTLQEKLAEFRKDFLTFKLAEGTILSMYQEKSEDKK